MYCKLLHLIHCNHSSIEVLYQKRSGSNLLSIITNTRKPHIRQTLIDFNSSDPMLLCFHKIKIHGHQMKLNTVQLHVQIKATDASKMLVFKIRHCQIEEGWMVNKVHIRSTTYLIILEP